MAIKYSQKISFVIPMYDEQEGALLFHNDILNPIVTKINYNYEIIYINDGSKDSTLNILQKIAQKDKKVKVISLSKNFGKEIATTAGINIANGDSIIILDGDGQHPPKMIDQFIKKWQDGAQVVVGVRNKNRNDSLAKRWCSKIFYKLFNSYSGATIVPRSTDYRLIDKVVQQEFIKFSERNRITRGLIDWLGFKKDYVYFDSPERLVGTATYKSSQLFRLALNSFVSLSIKPLLISGYLGVGIFLISSLVGIFIIIEQIIIGDPLGLKFTGTAMLSIFISFLVSIVLISQSMIAIYLSHIHAQTQARPLFIINPIESVNLDETKNK